MPRLPLAALTPWITAAAVQHGAALPQHLMATLGVSRRRAGALLRRLEAAQWLLREGPARRPLWTPGALREVVRRYPLAGLAEDRPWHEDFAPFFALPPAVARMARQAFGELVNNAVEHSGGTQVTVSMRQTPLQLQLLVSDDGCGLFERIAACHEIRNPRLAVFELAKGRLTSSPDRHSGCGLFFTAQLADVFDLHANAHAFQRTAWGAQPWRETRPAARAGTSVYLAIALDTTRTLDAVRAAHSADGSGAAFERTRVPLRLLGHDGVLDSRAEARRVAARLERFRLAELDFAGVDDIGHAFADELFRVIARARPQLRLAPVAMNARVAGIVAGVQAGA